MANPLLEKATMGVNPPGITDSRPRQPRPLVPRGPLDPWLRPLRYRRHWWHSCDTRRESRVGTYTHRCRQFHNRCRQYYRAARPSQLRGHRRVHLDRQRAVLQLRMLWQRWTPPQSWGIQKVNWMHDLEKGNIFYRRTILCHRGWCWRLLI